MGTTGNLQRVQSLPSASFPLAIVIIVTGIALTAVPIAARTAEPFPNRPIRMIVPFTAGSATDLIARRLAYRMSDNWNQQVVVDNRGGAGGAVGSGIVAKANPDGYTLLVHSIAFAMNAALYAKLPFDPVRDLTGVSQITVSTSLLVVAPTLGVKSVKELIALARQKPGQLNFSSSGVGSGMHLNSEQFRFAAGIDVVHVPYKGVPEQLVDIVTGRNHYALTPLVPALPFIRDGRLLALAVSTPRRAAILPEVPTIAEAALPGYEFQAWFGVFAPAATPRPVINQVSKEIARIVELPDIKKQFLLQGEEGKPSTPEEFSRFVRDEIDKTREIVKRAGIRVE
jgi:tripartite-type tricarboxylate transporter receptor subunit TctC